MVCKGWRKVFPKKLYEDFEVSEGIYNLKIGSIMEKSLLIKL